FAGALSDRVGRKPLWWFSLGGLFVGAVPLYLLMGSGMAGAVIGFALLGLLYVPQAWVTPAEIGIDALTSIYVSMGVTSAQYLQVRAPADGR
ncbi:MAG: hypothetical protein B7Z52_05270, partial [Burkholderiales bacterium 12-64-5]